MDWAALLIALCCLHFGVTRDLNGVPLEECQKPHPLNYTTEYCGYELGDNYTFTAAYTCSGEGGPPTYGGNCNGTYGKNEHEPTPPIFCAMSRVWLPNYRLYRRCYSIIQCTELYNFCGFNDIEEVRNYIRATIKPEPTDLVQRNRLYRLNKSIKADKEDPYTRRRTY